jgi:hypothetical protein
MSETTYKSSPHNAMSNPTTARISILSLLRLSIGMVGDMETNPPDDEEKELVEKVFELRKLLTKSLDKNEVKMIIAMAAITQILEDILCHYEDDMPDILTAIMTKLSYHAIQHMQLKDNPPQEIKFTGTVH